MRNFLIEYGLFHWIFNYLHKVIGLDVALEVSHTHVGADRLVGVVEVHAHVGADGLVVGGTNHGHVGADGLVGVGASHAHVDVGADGLVRIFILLDGVWAGLVHVIVIQLDGVGADVANVIVVLLGGVDCRSKIKIIRI